MMTFPDDYIKALGEPYYQDDAGLIYCGDCLDYLKKLPDKCVDLVLTDPPYGLDFDYIDHDDNRLEWFDLMDAMTPIVRRLGDFVIMPSSGIDRLQWWYRNHSPDWLISWYKGSPGHLSKIGFNDWESLLVFGKPPSQMHDHFQTKCGISSNNHPCPKPVEWARWLMSRGSENNDLILDPFLGSGTTAVAAKQLGRKYIGIEISQAYVDIAVQRLAQEELF